MWDIFILCLRELEVINEGQLIFEKYVRSLTLQEGCSGFLVWSRLHAVVKSCIERVKVFE
jgi:predicted metal-binding protein